MDMDIDETRQVAEFIEKSRMENSLFDPEVMEITFEEFEQAVAPRTNSPAPAGTSWLVLDTNSLISSMRVVKQIVEMAPKFHIVLVVPRQVIRELDGLKNQTKIEPRTGIDVGKAARQANLWVYEKLGESHPSVRGQRLAEVLDSKASKDDAILDCCLWFQQQYPDDLVALVSGDRNLCAKALVEKVRTISIHPEMTAKVICETVFQERQASEGDTPPLPRVNGNHTATTRAPERPERPERSESSDELLAARRLSHRQKEPPEREGWDCYRPNQTRSEPRKPAVTPHKLDIDRTGPGFRDRPPDAPWTSADIRKFNAIASYEEIDKLPKKIKVKARKQTEEAIHSLGYRTYWQAREGYIRGTSPSRKRSLTSQSSREPSLTSQPSSREPSSREPSSRESASRESAQTSRKNAKLPDLASVGSKESPIDLDSDDSEEVSKPREVYYQSEYKGEKKQKTSAKAEPKPKVEKPRPKAEKPKPRAEKPKADKPQAEKPRPTKDADDDVVMDLEAATDARSMPPMTLEQLAQAPLAERANVIYKEITVLVVAAVKSAIAYVLGKSVPYDTPVTLYDCCKLMIDGHNSVFNRFFPGPAPFDTGPKLYNTPTSGPELVSFVGLWVAVLQHVYVVAKPPRENEALERLAQRWWTLAF
ncbi:hypothetical protein DICA0_E03400 [Diutina catenulata]